MLLASVVSIDDVSAYHHKYSPAAPTAGHIDHTNSSLYAIIVDTEATARFGCNKSVQSTSGRFPILTTQARPDV
jgi:hypothetical protein